MSEAAAQEKLAKEKLAQEELEKKKAEEARKAIAFKSFFKAPAAGKPNGVAVSSTTRSSDSVSNVEAEQKRLEEMQRFLETVKSGLSIGDISLSYRAKYKAGTEFIDKRLKTRKPKTLTVTITTNPVVPMLLEDEECDDTDKSAIEMIDNSKDACNSPDREDLPAMSILGGGSISLNDDTQMSSGDIVEVAPVEAPTTSAATSIARPPLVSSSSDIF